MFESEIHRVYTEQTSPMLTDEHCYYIACQDKSEFSDEYFDELILTTIDSNVTCKLCLEALK